MKICEYARKKQTNKKLRGKKPREYTQQNPQIRPQKNFKENAYASKNALCWPVAFPSESLVHEVGNHVVDNPIYTICVCPLYSNVHGIYINAPPQTLD